MNGNLYADDICNTETNMYDFEDIFSQMKKMDKKVRKLSKKKKNGKKGKKKKKAKKELKKLKKERKQLKSLLRYSAQSNQVSQSVWWQDALIQSLPSAIELATATINQKPTKGSTK